MTATKFCRTCGLEAPLPVLMGAERPPCVMCQKRDFVPEYEVDWPAKVNNKHDREFLRVNKIAIT